MKRSATTIISLLTLTAIAVYRLVDPSATEPVPPQGSGATQPTHHLNAAASGRNWVAVIAVIISVLALFVAGATLYYTIILRTDDIRIISSSSPLLFVDDKGALGLSGQQHVMFFNAGNRSAAITETTAVITRFPKEPAQNYKRKLTSDKKCAQGQIARLPYNFEPFVSEPGKILAKIFDKIPSSSPSWPVTWKTDVNDSNKKMLILGKSYFREGDVALICLDFTISTPHETVYRTLRKYFVEINHIPFDGHTVSSIVDADQPFGIFYAKHTIFRD